MLARASQQPFTACQKAVGANEEEPVAMIHDGAGTDPADLRPGVGHSDAVRASVGDLLQ